MKPDENKILEAADAALSGRGNFIERFWGGSVLKNGPHVGNRVGHVQGGILMRLAAASAAAALPKDWRLSGISAAFVSPGKSGILRARSRMVHRGGLTAVVRTTIGGPVLEVLTSHASSLSRAARRTP